MERQPATTAAALKAADYVPLGALPRLEAGDHLDQPTFHARYEGMPPSFRAELVEGVVIVPSPVSMSHGEAHNLIMGWMFVYRARTAGVRCLDNATVILSEESEPQPDGTLILEPACGGQTREEKGYLVGAPELIVEIASSPASYDLHSKFRTYEAAGVREYLVLVLQEERARWFALRDRVFVESAPTSENILRSTFFPGLWLDVPALFARNATLLLATLECGLATPAHAQQAANWRRLMAHTEGQGRTDD